LYLRHSPTNPSRKSRVTHRPHYKNAGPESPPIQQPKIPAGFDLVHCRAGCPAPRMKLRSARARGRSGILSANPGEWPKIRDFHRGFLSSGVWRRRAGFDGKRKACEWRRIKSITWPFGKRRNKAATDSKQTWPIGALEMSKPLKPANALTRRPAGSAASLPPRA